ncbi:MAG: hypothetical protein ACYTEK_24430 [Planctomycetota bacterium]|jgi:hypothetical protein
MEVTSGFLIVKTFERMCREYPAKFERCRKAYPEITHNLIPLEQMPGQYRGVARDPIEPWIEAFHGAGLFDEPTEQELAASLFKTKLREAGKAEGFFIFALDDARELFGMIDPPVEREIIWARRTDRDDAPPAETEILGYEPIDFDGDFSSLIADVAFFRTLVNADIDDPDGTRSRIHYAKFNKWGLFDAPSDAHEYVDSFPLLPEHERPRHIAEVRAFR